MIARRLALLALFAGLTGGAALLLDRIVEPSIALDLLLAAALGLIAGLPGFVHTRLGLLSLFLLPAGAYLLLRIYVPLPEAIGGWGASWAFYGEELRDGLTAYADAIFPLTLTGVPGMKILVLLWVYLITAGAAGLALGSGRLLAGVAALIGLLAFTFTVDDLSRDLQAALTILLLLVLILMTAQALNRRHWGFGDVASGIAVGGASVAMSVLLLGGMPGLAADGWQDWRQWDLFDRGGGEEIVFNWKQNYPRLLDPANDFPVMVVTSPQPSYWRANTLEVFAGDAWVSELVEYEPLPLNSDGTSRDVAQSEPVPPGEELVQEFELQGVSTTFLFTGGAPRRLDIDSPVSVYVSPAGILRAEFALRPPVKYSVTSVIPRLRPQDLVDLGREYEVDDIYFQVDGLPTAAQVRQLKEQGADWEEVVASSSPRGSEFLRLYDLNDQIVGEATDPYQIALRIERHLRTNFEYSLELPRSDFRSPYAAFLFDTQTGYCQHFSGVMALLLRVNGIPSRVAVGFTTGDFQGGNSFQVSTNNAHAWVEVYFPGVGWLPFDPTPGRNLPTPGPSLSSPDFTDPFAHAGGAPQDQPQIPDERRSLLPEEGGGATGAAPTVSTAQRLLRAALVLSLGAVAVVGWPFLRRWRRQRGLRRGSREDRLRASLGLMRADLHLWNVPAPDALTIEEVAALVTREAELDLRDVFARVQKVLYGGRAASQADVAGLELARRELNRILGRRRGRLWRLMVAYGGGRFAVSLFGSQRRKIFGSGALVRRAMQAARGVTAG